jgi:hypothetical protein
MPTNLRISRIITKSLVGASSTAGTAGYKRNALFCVKTGATVTLHVRGNLRHV